MEKTRGTIGTDLATTDLTLNGQVDELENTSEDSGRDTARRDEVMGDPSSSDTSSSSAPVARSSIELQAFPLRGRNRDVLRLHREWNHQALFEAKRHCISMMQSLAVQRDLQKRDDCVVDSVTTSNHCVPRRRPREFGLRRVWDDAGPDQ